MDQETDEDRSTKKAQNGKHGASTALYIHTWYGSAQERQRSLSSCEKPQAKGFETGAQAAEAKTRHLPAKYWSAVSPTMLSVLVKLSWVREGWSTR